MFKASAAKNANLITFYNAPYLTAADVVVCTS